MKSCIIWCKKKNSDFFWKKDFTVALKEKHQIINKCETGLEFPDVKIDTGIDSIIDR